MPYKIPSTLDHAYLVGGQLTTNETMPFIPSINPATGEVLGYIADATTTQLDMAIMVAKEAQATWSRLRARERGQYLWHCADLLDQHSAELTQLLILETGKALRTEGTLEIDFYTQVLRFYAGLGPEIKGQTLPFDPNILAYTVHEPVGVVAAIIPWNVPVFLMMLKVAPALLAGNSVIVKPSEEASFIVLRVAEIMNTILPPGLLNVLPGRGENIGAALVQHPGINKVSFTGSVETGRLIAKSAGERLIPVTLELGGKSPMIIYPDVDLDKVVAGAIAGVRFTRQGQSCSAASRIFVHYDIFEPFVEKMKSALNQLVIGDPMDEKTDVGALISEIQYKKVLGYIEEARALPYTEVIECAQLPKDPKLSKGYYLRPTLILEARNSDRICQEEIFGPVTCIIPWEHEEDVIDQANATSFGLAGTVWTKDISKALTIVDQLQAGFVQVNQNLVVQPGLPYGGFKNSGIGKEASLESMIAHFMKTKTIMVNKESL